MPLPNPPGPAPSGGWVIFSAESWNWIGRAVIWLIGATQQIYTASQSNGQLDVLKSELDAIQLKTAILPKIDARLEALQGELDAIRSSIRLLTVPTHGTIRVFLKENPMTVSVHPSDTLAAVVAWENAAGTVVPETGPTTWSAEDLGGAPFSGVTMAAGDDDDHETVTFSDPAETASFVLVATMTPDSGLPVLVAKSEEIDVSPSNQPTQGVVSISITPGL